MEKKPSDHALAIVKAGISAVPIVGGSIASLIGDYIPSSTQRSIEQAIDDLTQQLSELQARIDPETMNHEEFAELFKSCYLVLVRTHQTKTRRGAVRLIVNALLRPGDRAKLSYTELDHFVRCLDSLSNGALEVLGHALSLAKLANFQPSRMTYYRFNFSDLQHRLPETESSLLLGLVGELNAFSLLHQPGIPTGRDEKNLYGNYPVELTIVGARFGEYVLGEHGA